jgi:hypothetical protein
MGQTDRYSQKQIDQLKTYRQDLRDMINNNQDKLDLLQPIEFPPEPEIIQQASQKAFH